MFQRESTKSVCEDLNNIKYDDKTMDYLNFNVLIIL